jgi:hypothetical protein
MRKLISILKDQTRTLKVFESKNKLRGEIYENGALVMAADFFVKDNDATEHRVIEYFNFNNYYRVPFERKNGKIVLYPVNKQKRIIWTNDDYEEWCEAMQSEITDEEITPEYYAFCCDNNLDDERANLNVEVDGYIVAFASLGLWNGRVNGAKLVGDNVKDILHSNDDYVTWYCDPYNVKAEMIHHDGTNYVIYRVAKNKEQAERLVDKIAYHGMTEEEFRRATKSLKPYVAAVYGW